MKRSSELRRAVKRFEGFHARKADKVGRVNVPYPKALVYLGEGFAIEYVSDKHVLALGDRRSMEKGKSRRYRHRFSTNVKIYADADGTTLFIRGGRFRVTDWMRD